MGNEDIAALTPEKTVVNFYKIFKKRDCGSGESLSTVSFFCQKIQDLVDGKISL